MKEAKEQYQDLYRKVQDIINRHDPANLDPGMEDGTPIDEYGPEIAQIVAFLVHNQEDIKLNPQILVKEINRVWQEFFDETCTSAEQISLDIIRECM